MKKLKLLAVAAVAALSLTACYPGVPPTKSETTLPNYPVAQNVDLTGSPTWVKAHNSGTLKIGVKFDQPGMSYKRAGSEQPQGFDVQVGKMIAAGLGFQENQIDWVETVSKNREPFLQNNQVDLVIGTYTINDKRKQVVDFAGPYYVSGMGFLTGNAITINSTQDLDGKKICTANGSSTQNDLEKLQAQGHKFEVKLYDSYSKCMSDLESGSVQVVSTDDSILLGYSEQYGAEKFKLSPLKITEEPYGIGVPKGDVVLRSKINDILVTDKQNGDFAKAFVATLGNGKEATFPDVQRYDGDFPNGQAPEGEEVDAQEGQQ